MGVVDTSALAPTAADSKDDDVSQSKGLPIGSRLPSRQRGTAMEGAKDGEAQRRTPPDQYVQLSQPFLKRNCWHSVDSDCDHLQAHLDNTAVTTTQRMAVAALFITMVPCGMQTDMSAVINPETPAEWGLRDDLEVRVRGKNARRRNISPPGGLLKTLW